MNERKRAHRWVPALVAFAFVAGACGGDETTDSAAAPDDATTTEAAQTTDEEADTGDSAESEEAESGDSAETEEEEAEESAEAEPFVADGPIAAGAYAAEALGTDFTFTVEDGWVGVFDEPAAWLIEKEDKSSDFTDYVLAVRVEAFPGAGESAAEPPRFTGASDDVDGWLDDAELIVENREATTVGGHPAERMDIRLDPDGTGTIPQGCGPGPDDRCFFVAQTRSGPLQFFIVRTTEIYRLWIVEQEGFDPILLMAGALEDNPEFLDEADAIVASIELGEPQPQPVDDVDGPEWEAGVPSVVPGGEPLTVPALGGITFTLESERFLFQDQDFVTIESTEPSEGAFPPAMIIAHAWQTQTGDEVADAEAFLDVLRLESEVTESGTTIEALGLTLVGYDLVGPDAPPEVFFSTARLGDSSNGGYLPGPFARVWVADGPDGGAIVITAEAASEAELELAQALVDSVLPTLSYTAG